MLKTVPAPSHTPAPTTGHSSEMSTMILSGLKPFLTTATVSAAALAVGAIVVFLISRNIKARRKSAKTQASVTTIPRDSHTRSKQGGYLNPADPKDQLAIVSMSNYQPQKLMNTSEYRLFAVIEGMLPKLGKGYRLMAQVSLGEVINAVGTDKRALGQARSVINSKRIDMALIDAKGTVAVAIEYQGGGHHQGNAFMRDAVKREALRRAGIPMLEVDTSWTPELIQQQISHLLAPQPSA